MDKIKYTPKPVDTSDVSLTSDMLELTELIAKNVHEIWAKQRIEEGWTFGPIKNSELKTTHPWPAGCAPAPSKRWWGRSTYWARTSCCTARSRPTG